MIKKRLNKLFQPYKTPFLYTGGALLQSLVQLLVGFAVARYVPPEDLGLWTTINLAVTYSSFLQAGLISGLNRELPYSLGKGKYIEAKIMAGTVQSITLITALLIIIIGFISFFFIDFDNLKIKYGVLAVAIYIAALFFQNYFTSTFRSNNSFIKLSKIQVINSIISLFSITLIIYFAYYGLILKTVLISVLLTILLYIKRPIKVGFIINKSILLKILKTGLPIWALAYIVSVAATSDKLWLLKYSTISDVGIYSFAFYGYSLFLVLSTTIAKYISPRMTYNYGLNNNKNDLWIYFKKITSINFIFQSIIMVLAIMLIPYLITTFFPQYINSTQAMQVLVVAGMLKGSIIGVNVLVSMNAIKYLTAYQLIYSFLLFIFPFLGIKLLSSPVLGVAYGLLCANLLNLASGIIFTRIATKK